MTDAKDKPGQAPHHGKGEGGDSTGSPALQGGSRGAGNAMGRHSKDADHAPGSPAELHKAKGTETSKD